jgi:RNase P/RNase MRP subunit p30
MMGEEANWSNFKLTASGAEAQFHSDFMSRLYRLRKKWPIVFVIPSGARNLSSIQAQEKKERFLAPLGMTK